MEYKLTINEKTEKAEVSDCRDNTFEAAMGRDRFKVSFSRISDHQIHLVVNGQNLNAYVIREGDARTIMIDGKSFTVRDADIQERSGTTRKGVIETATEITPPMPAVVTLVPVKKGDRVTKGDTVVTVSAMKMETALTAPYSGTVTGVNVAQGDKVMPGEILVEILEEESEKQGAQDSPLN